MTRLFGCTCNQPQRLSEALAPVRHVLSVPGPVARWGLGYVQAGQVLLRRHPRGSEATVDFYEAVRNVKSDYLIGCAAENDGLKGNDNTPPFRFRRWLFAQEGSIENFDQISPRLLEHIPGFIRRNIRGKVPAEQIFHVFLSLLYDAGQLDVRDVDPAACRRALGDALGIVRAVLSEGGQPTELGNLVLTNGRSMMAARLGGPMYVRRLRQLADPKQPDTEFRAVLVLSAAEMPAEGFEEIPIGSAVTVSRDLNTDIAPLSA